MLYDVPFRYQQALDPSLLPTISATLRAIDKAQKDCRNAGVDPESDPAVVLLARHMATVSTNRRPREVLRQACLRRLSELKRFPTLLSLAVRGVEYDAGAKERFHIDATAAIHRLARALDLAPGTFEVVSLYGTPDESGQVLLAAKQFTVTVSIGLRTAGREVAYRSVSAGPGVLKHYAPIAELLKPDRLAARLRRDLPNITRPGADTAMVIGEGSASPYAVSAPMAC